MGSLGLPVPEKIEQSLQVSQSGFEPGEVSFPLVAEVASALPWRPRSSRAGSAGRHPHSCSTCASRTSSRASSPTYVARCSCRSIRLPKLAGYTDRDVVVVCRAGACSATACAMLATGFARVQNLAGGMLASSDAGLPSEH